MEVVCGPWDTSPSFSRIPFTKPVVIFQTWICHQRKKEKVKYKGNFRSAPKARGAVTREETKWAKYPAESAYPVVEDEEGRSMCRTEGFAFNGKQMEHRHCLM